MKAIFSHLDVNKYRCKESNYNMLTAYANFWAKKQGFETVFFGDERTLKNFKEIEFDDTCKISSELYKELPKNFWSASKLISLSLMNEPCIHIDNDLFLTEKIPSNFLQNDIYCYHHEAFVNFNHLQNNVKIRPPETIGYPTISYNCGIMGGQDINTIKNSVNIVLDFVSTNSNYLESVTANGIEIHSNNISVLIEQIWLYQIIKYFNKTIAPLIEVSDWKDWQSKSLQSGYIHLMKNKKDKPILTKIEQILITNNIKY